ncbi:PilW family protein [Geoalkalibacter halelectricus]|uniref:Prepilin-type N-terminal cleavage/methylation domain-containing protein n=1 Tax=Geoalkalibacter halelectricus TaxID=2847045 RepID=A0ABY5ZLH6_9BACT|nr:prepilin-type N-terminal cleavage/methylation domain-containing protein [Geoalkalibacter halelectricus]MDO3376801.1 prepilin-type N-terminal cleavage/methylation domain-containing protein [Geoalkalibacter halelectricus]UWZ79556.1 prepilin-type N-terminal cleavage/methylation domain-containing protein [Geoalkalibacter halelectricus]
MTRTAPHRDQGGFTLIEVLIVTALLGVVMAAVFALVQTSQRHAHTSEEVVEVQQNLRVALERMSRDLRLAGLGVADEDIFVARPDFLRCEGLDDDGDCLDSNALIFRTLSAPGQIARINDELTTTAAEHVLRVASADMARLFHEEDYVVNPVYVRIFRPATRVQPLDRVFQVMAANPDSADPTLTLNGFNTSVSLRPGDLIARVEVRPGVVDPNSNPPEHPNQIRYRLVRAESADEDQFLLARIPTGVDPDDRDAFEILASKITGVTFEYFQDNQGDVRAVRITLTGATDATRTGVAGYLAPGQDNNVRTRSLTTVVQLRNR